MTSRNRRFSQAWRWLAGWAILIAVLVTFYGLCAWMDLAFSYDSATLFSPYFTLVADFARSGQLLLWNPWSNCGSPDAAYVEMGSFSPLTLLVAWFTGGGEAGFVVYWLVIWGLGGTGILVLGRYLGSPAWCASAVAISFMFSGFYLGNATHTSWLYAFSFLPWMLWRIDVGLHTRQLRPSCEAGALYGLAALAGHPAMIVLNGLFVGAWTLGRCLFADPARNKSVRMKRSGARWRPWAGAALQLTLLVGVALIILSPAYAIFFKEGAGYSDRTGYVPRQIAVSDQALPATALGTLTSPYLPFLKGFNSHLWPNVFAGLTCNYIGAVVPALAFLAISRYRYSLWYGWLLLIAIFCLACAVGPALPIRGWLYDICPPTRFFRHSSVFRAYFLFAITLLALVGGREMSSKRPSDWAALCLSSGYLLLFAAAGYGLTLRQVPEWGTGILFSHVHFLIAWTGLPLLALAACHQSVDFAVRAAPLLLVSVSLLDGALTLAHSGGVMLQRRTSTDARPRVTSLDLVRHGLNRKRHPPGAYPTNDNLYSKIPMLENFNTLNNRFHTRAGLGTADWAALPTSWCDEPVLADSCLGRLPRIWFTPQAIEIRPTTGNFAAFAARARTLDAMPFVIHAPSEVRAALSQPAYHTANPGHERAVDQLPAAQPIKTRIERYTPNELTFEVTCPSDGWLLVTERWARGWRAQVGGSATPIHVGNFIFRALPVRTGTQSVAFRYRPFGHPWLMLVSWTVLAVIGAGSARSFVRWLRA